MTIRVVLGLRAPTRRLGVGASMSVERRMRAWKPTSSRGSQTPRGDGRRVRRRRLPRSESRENESWPGSLYPALQQLERAGLIASEWGISDNNRRARFYKLTRAGRKKLVAETGKWEQLVRAVKGVLQARPEEEQA